MRHLIDPLDFSQEEITSLLNLADRIRSDPAAYQDVAAHKKLATLFYEPSTRTRLSFEAAMLNLGGHVLGFPSETVSSASKGESVADTIRVVSCYADIVAMRHPKEGAPFRASRYSRIPVINAGDGGHQHPTQTMTDLMTIRTRMGRLDNLTIGLCGDLKFGRTVHSLIKTMARCKNIRFVLISPEELRVPDYIIKDVLEANGIEYCETRSLEESMPELDILYMTRVQKERFFNEEDYIRLKNTRIPISKRGCVFFTAISFAQRLISTSVMRKLQSRITQKKFRFVPLALWSIRPGMILPGFWKAAVFPKHAIMPKIF